MSQSFFDGFKAGKAGSRFDPARHPDWRSGWDHGTRFRIRREKDARNGARLRSGQPKRASKESGSAPTSHRELARCAPRPGRSLGTGVRQVPSEGSVPALAGELNWWTPATERHLPR